MKKTSFKLFLIFSLQIIVLILCTCIKPSHYSKLNKRYTVQQLLRKNKNSIPIVSGIVDQREGNKIFSMTQSIIIINDNIIFSDSSGRYVKELKPGRLHLKAKWIGYETITIKPIKIQRGDSIRVNIYMHSDTVNNLR